MTRSAESPHAAPDWTFGEASIITKPTSCVVRPDDGEKSISFSVIKNTAPELTKVDDDEAFHSNADTSTGRFTYTDTNPVGAATLNNLTTSTDAKSPVATALDASPHTQGATTFLPTTRVIYWTQAEKDRLAIAVKTYGEGKWDAIAAMIPNRSKVSCAAKWADLVGRYSLSPQLNWRDEQEKRLFHVVNKDLGDWGPDRSGLARKEKRKRMMGKWSSEEDQELAQAVKACGERNWKKIAKKVPKRTIGQCGLRLMTKRAASRDPPSRVYGIDETATAIAQVAKICDAGDSDGVAETCSRQPRTDREETKLIHAVNTCDSVVETVPGRTEVACSGQPWTDEEIKRLVDAVKTHGEWGKWAAIAAMVPNRSEAECSLKWTSTTPEWTLEEDMLLAMAVKACGKGVWLQVAARVPGRTMLNCLIRWTVLVEASRTSIDRLPVMSGGITNPVGAVETFGEENEVTIVAVVPGRSDLQRQIKRQRTISSYAAAVLNQPTGVPVNTTAARSVNDGTWAWVPHQLPARTVVPTLQHSPPINAAPQMLQQPDVAFGSPISLQQRLSATIISQHQKSP